MISSDEKKSPNNLINEKSPYLLQHALNPVNWYPWGQEAFQKAKREDKPVFLSIGYATCHWCHVMAHESFEDPEVARFLNAHFVSIKVDREERPDIDKIYMSVCQAMTGSGGWPLSVFLTPEAKPFFAGTYFPKVNRMGMTGLMSLLNQIALMWHNERERLLKAGEEITSAIKDHEVEKSGPTVTLDTLKKGHDQLARTFDPEWGGFGREPKFPTPHQLTFLLRWHLRSSNAQALAMVEKTLDAMRNGGIFDHIGFGFHRYSVDSRWLVPHFEKMLYDQAMLAMVYTEASQVTGKASFGRAAREIFAYVLRDMTDPEGGFYSAEDADSEGKEGLFYLWTPEEVKKILGEEPGELFCRFYHITVPGNFEEGYSIPHIPVGAENFIKKEGIGLEKLENTLEDCREKLFTAREKRVHPLKDDKIITSWNGLMIAALSKGSQVFGEKAYADAAANAAQFILKNLRTNDGRLLRRFRQKEALYPGYLDDYAFLVWGLIELYEATFDIIFLEEAVALNQAMLDIFWDDQHGGLYFTGKGNESLITQSKDLYDGALPSGNSVAALNFLRISRITGNSELEQKAEQLIQAFSKDITSSPIAYTQLLASVDFMFGPAREIVISGDPLLKDTQAMVKAVRKRFLPNKVVLLYPQGSEGQKLVALSPFVGNMVPTDKKPTAFVCEQYACKTPITDAEQLENLLG
jgi:uncharacterized protein